MLDTIPPEKGSFEQRLPLPEAWSGLQNAELAAVTGVPDAVFVHVRRFVAAAKSREVAIDRLMAEYPFRPSFTAHPPGNRKIPAHGRYLSIVKPMTLELAVNRRTVTAKPLSDLQDGCSRFTKPKNQPPIVQGEVTILRSPGKFLPNAN